MTLLNELIVNGGDVEDIFQGNIAKVFIRQKEKIRYFDTISKNDLFSIDEEEFKDTR